MGRRKKKHEDHINHEAWAIPYGDLITLLLAFFVVMYAISSVNAGKFRVLSDFTERRLPRQPDHLRAAADRRESARHGRGHGNVHHDAGADFRPSPLVDRIGAHRWLQRRGRGRRPLPGAGEMGHAQPVAAESHPMATQLSRVADELQGALQSLVDADLVAVRRHQFWLEVEVRSDILFPSGVASLSDKAPIRRWMHWP